MNAESILECAFGNAKGPMEGSFGAIHNWHDDAKWSHYQIVGGKAQLISEARFHELRDEKATMNQPLYEEEKELA